ncbi:MAG: hypothetical protein K8S27_12570 [Candidatus Omnitrophica bacterium]|nr:hypothetical protein [Candidatus Omnitrophota bacterium]
MLNQKNGLKIIFYMPIKRIILFSLVLILINTQIAFAAASDPPNFQPDLTIKYLDTVTNKKITLRHCLPGKTYNVPSGVTLTLIIETLNLGDNPSGDPVSIDIWYDWPYRYSPKDDVDADAVCLPEGPGDCSKTIKKLKADHLYAGKVGKGVYNIVVWVDRFGTQTEVDEKDNFLGPIRIVAVPIVQNKQEPLQIYSPNRKTIKRKY